MINFNPVFRARAPRFLLGFPPLPSSSCACACARILFFSAKMAETTPSTCSLLINSALTQCSFAKKTTLKLRWNYAETTLLYKNCRCSVRLCRPLRFSKKWHFTIARSHFTIVRSHFTIARSHFTIVRSHFTKIPRLGIFVGIQSWDRCCYSLVVSAAVWLLQL